MSALAQWNQYRELEALRHGLGSLFGRAPVRLPEGQEEQITVPEWAPLVDISEDDKEYLIKAELPEVKKEDVKVTAEEGTLTIMGERKFEKEEKGRKYHRVERSYGSFGRSFSLPDVGGLLVSQLLTLYITPVYYVYLERFQQTASRLFRRQAEPNSALTGEPTEDDVEIPIT